MNHSVFIQFINIVGKSEVSLSQLQKELNIDAQSLTQLITFLQQHGLAIRTANHNQLFLSEYVEPIHLASIECFLLPSAKNGCVLIPPFLSIDSTNTYLKNSRSDLSDRKRFCFAEYQTSGRGRRGKTWLSPLARNICMSLHTRLNIPLNAIGGVSLMVGISIVQACQELGVEGLRIKWPNDIYWQGKKLAGILIETTKLIEGSVELVIGIGVNMDVPQHVRDQIDQPCLDLRSIVKNHISKNRLIAEIINSIYLNIDKYEHNGLQTFMNEWMDLDYLFQKTITVIIDDNEYEGIALGISEEGELLMKVEHKIMTIQSGEIQIHRDDRVLID